MNRYHKHYRFATIPRGAILDVGSGSNPFWRANVLMERFLEDDSQRPGKIIIDRPVVCGDIHDIPFVDDAFIFVHCSNILEHLDYLETAIDEITRVSKLGYIETPSEIHEYIDLDFPFHRWAVSIEDDVLVFREKQQHSPKHPLVEALRSSENMTGQIIRKHHDQINFISWFWKGKVNHRIERCNNPIECYAPTDEPPTANNYVVTQTKSKIKLLLGKLFSQKINLYKILACPICKKRVQKVNSKLICVKCSKKYPIINNIPMMLKDCAQDFD